MLYLFALARLRPLLIHRARQRFGAGEVSDRNLIACTEGLWEGIITQLFDVLLLVPRTTTVRRS